MIAGKLNLTILNISSDIEDIDMNTFNKIASIDSDEEVLVAQHFNYFKNEQNCDNLMYTIGEEIGPIARTKNNMNFVKFMLKAKKNIKKIKLKNVEPTVSIKIDSTKENERFFISLLSSQMRLACMLYFLELRHEKGEAFAVIGDDTKTWFDAQCPHYNGEVKYLDNIFQMLNYVKPDYIMFFNDFYKEHKESSEDFESGLGLILLDKNGNPLQKVNLKFFDLRNAPTHAFRLNSPSPKDDFDMAESFDRPLFN